MRTLVVGIPLPHVTFDNYSFASAPSLDEYQRLIVNIESVSNVVTEVADATAEHRSFAGQPVLNGPSTANSFGLPNLLAMRRREAERLLAQNGVVVCFSHPDSRQNGIAEIEHWNRYDWLPAPAGFVWEKHLLPGFGIAGTELLHDDHAFATYITEFRSHIAYRATIDETSADFSDYGRPFVRSAGGAVIGAELRVGNGHIILLPPLVGTHVDRSSLAQTLFDCLERFQAKSADRIREELP